MTIKNFEIQESKSFKIINDNWAKNKLAIQQNSDSAFVSNIVLKLEIYVFFAREKKK